MKYCCNGILGSSGTYKISDARETENAANYNSKTLDHLGIVSAVCKEINLAGEIDRIIGVDPRQKVTGSCCHGPKHSWIRGPTTVPIPRVHGDETGGDIDKGRIGSRGVQ